MKIKLSVSNERFDEIRKLLLERGIEIDDNADLVLCEANKYIDNLIVKNSVNERIVLPVDEIAYIETYGHLVEVRTANNIYQAMGRLYQIANMLDPDKFLRISNSVIVARDKVKKITPTLSMKFVLTMVDGRDVDVTRSYYYIFKDSFGI